MRKLFFLSMVSAAAAAVASCTIEHSAVVPVSEGELVTLRVGISNVQTRADDGSVDDGSGYGDDGSDLDGGSGSTVPSSESEAKVNTLQVLVFSHETGGLERSAYDSTGAYSVEMTCYTGLKDVVAIVNAPEEVNWLKVSTLTAFNDLVSRLDENSDGNFFMYGKTLANVPDDEYIGVEVNRRVARVALNKILNNVANNGVVGELYLNDVYLINVAGESDYGCSESYVPDLWYNQSGLDFDLPSELGGFLCGGIEGDGHLAGGESYEERQVFYCYPNFTAEDSNSEEWSKRCTRLVVEATLNGNKWYYPITLDRVEPNCTYEIELTIEGAGADGPDKEPRNANYWFYINVASWNVENVYESI